MPTNCETNSPETNRGFVSSIKAWFEDVEKEVPTTVNCFKLPFDSNNINGTQASVENPSMNGTRLNNQTTLGSKSVSGSIPMQPDEKTSLFVAKALMGNFTNRACLKSGSDITTTLATWTAITDGEFKITINGTAQDVTAVDFSTATSMANVASILQTKIRASNVASGFTGAIVVWDNTHANNYRMVIKSGTVVATDGTGTSTIALLATVTTPAGTDLSSLLKMNTSNGTVVYERVFGINNCIPSVGIEKAFQRQLFLQKGLKLGQLGVSYEGEGNNRMTFSLDFTGAESEPIDVTIINGSTTDYTTGAIFNHFEAKIIPYESDQITEIARGLIKTFSLTVNNNLQPQFILDGTPTSYKIDEGKISITGNLTALFKTFANSYLSEAVAETLIPIKVMLKKGVNELTFFLKDCKFAPTEPAQDTAVSVEYSIDYNTTNIEIIHVSEIASF